MTLLCVVPVSVSSAITHDPYSSQVPLLTVAGGEFEMGCLIVAVSSFRALFRSFSVLVYFCLCCLVLLVVRENLH